MFVVNKLSTGRIHSSFRDCRSNRNLYRLLCSTLHKYDNHKYRRSILTSLGHTSQVWVIRQWSPCWSHSGVCTITSPPRPGGHESFHILIAVYTCIPTAPRASISSHLRQWEGIRCIHLKWRSPSCYSVYFEWCMHGWHIILERGRHSFS